MERSADISVGFTKKYQALKPAFKSHIRHNTYCFKLYLSRSDEEEEGEGERERERERQECNLAQFWGRLGECVEATSNGHMLRDMAQVNLRLPQPLVPPEHGEEKVGLPFYWQY